MADQDNSQGNGTVATTPSTQESKQAFAQGQNDFAFKLYKHLQGQPGNLFFSPFSIWTALAMVFAGARGETAKEMQQHSVFPLQIRPLMLPLGRSFRG